MIVTHLLPNKKDVRVGFNGPGYVLVAELGAAGANIANAVSKAAFEEGLPVDPSDVIDQIYAAMIAHLTKEMPGMASEVREPGAFTNPASYLPAKDIPDGLQDPQEQKRRRRYRPS